jgi:hypothetical protein
MESTLKASDTIISREVYMLNPVNATPDLIITFCADSSACTGDVEAQMLDVLFGTQGPQVQPGFFSPDNFTFGG